MKDSKTFHWFSSILAALVILLTGIASTYAAAPKAADIVPASQNTLPENTLLQFSAGGAYPGVQAGQGLFRGL